MSKYLFILILLIFISSINADGPILFRDTSTKLITRDFVNTDGTSSWEPNSDNVGWIGGTNAFQGTKIYNVWFKPSSSPRSTSSTGAGETWMTNDTPDAGMDQWTIYMFNGTNWHSMLGFLGGVGAGAQAVQVFSSNGTWYKPSNLAYIKVEVIGGGGGSAGSGQYCGGGGGGYSMEIIDASELSASVSVSIGSGGAAGGGSGGTTSFGSFLQATGGSGGVTSGAGATGGSGSGGDLNINGGYGGTIATGTMGTGHGGESFYGHGGYAGYYASVNAGAGTWPGGGAGGGAVASTGAAGADGAVIVWEYFHPTAVSYTQEDSVQTTNATPDASIVYDLESGKSAYIKISVIAKVNGGTPGNSAAYVRECRAEDSGGTVSVYNVQDSFTSEDSSSWDVTLTNSGTNVAAQVTGESSTTIDWSIKWEVIDL